MAENTTKSNVETGNISVHTENIFPIIKKSLYSDHEIFLRELVSNAVDATQKAKFLASSGTITDELGDLTIRVSVDKEAKTITIKDAGIGLTGDEVKKYINQVAFSGAEEFLEKFKNAGDGKDIIGKFGLGFYSAFMVADRVEIISRSYKKNTSGIKWDCDGSTSYSLEKIKLTERGTEIILHVSEDSEEFLDAFRIKGILNKYCKFLPIEVAFVDIEEKDGETEIKDTVINKTDPIWKKAPTSLKDEDYLEFFKVLYPASEDPLFWIHLNVDYPFELTGILFFPKPTQNADFSKKDKIHLYSRQVFITDSVEEIVPDYLMLLQGVIDSPDIPLNVSRSYLQSDSNVKKISNYISKKVAEKLEEIQKEDKEVYESKWEDISTFVKYGIISDEKFAEKAEGICLYKNTEGNYYNFDEYLEKIKLAQSDKEDNTVVLYTSDPEKQSTFMEAALAKGYDILQMDSIIDPHFIGRVEQKNPTTRWKRIDSESAETIIGKEDFAPVSISDEEQATLKEMVEGILDNKSMTVSTKTIGENELPVLITRPEFMRRMQDMAATGGASPFGPMGDHFEVVVNTAHPLVTGLLAEADEDSRNRKAKQMVDIALLSQNLLTGKKLNAFIQRSIELIN